MTREEAISLIKSAQLMLINPTTNEPVSDLYEALEMAIKALEQEPCDDAISRDAVLDALLDYWHDIQFVDGSGYDVYEDCKAVIDELPSVTQKSGKWIKKGNTLKCPFCGAKAKDIKDDYCFNYCPNCGAKMESEE